MEKPRADKTQAVDPVQGLIAERLSKSVIDCDPAILSLMVVDNMGRVLHVARSSRLPPEETATADQIRLFGPIAKMIMGAANQANPIAGATEVVIGVFKHQKILLVNLQEYNVVMGLRIARSASGEYVSEKIRSLLASSG